MKTYEISMSDHAKHGMTFLQADNQREAEEKARRNWGHHFNADQLLVSAKEDTCGLVDSFVAAASAAHDAVSSNTPPDSSSVGTVPTDSATTKSVKP